MVGICIAVNLAGSSSWCQGRAIVIAILPCGECGAAIVSGSVEGLALVARVLKSGRHFLVAGEGATASPGSGTAQSSRLVLWVLWRWLPVPHPGPWAVLNHVQPAQLYVYPPGKGY